MNVKLHTPKTLQSGSGMSSAKQFLLSLIATTVSIVLTFGTAAVIDHHKKASAKKEMVMMVISDFDKTIELAQKADTALREAKSLQLELAANPEHFDSLRYVVPSKMVFINEEFSETAEKIFSTSIETFNTIGDVNFVNEVSAFYMARHKYKEDVFDKLREDLLEHHIGESFNTLMSVNFPEYSFYNWAYLQGLKEYRDNCMRMMKVSEEDMSKFSNRHKNEEVEAENNPQYLEMFEECEKTSAVIEQAREKSKK